MLDVTKHGQINLDSVMFDLYAIPLLSKACHQLLNQVSTHFYIKAVAALGKPNMSQSGTLLVTVPQNTSARLPFSNIVHKYLPTLGCSLLCFFIEPQKKQGTGQVDPDLSRTLRFVGHRLVLLSGNGKSIMDNQTLPYKSVLICE